MKGLFRRLVTHTGLLTLLLIWLVYPCEAITYNVRIMFNQPPPCDIISAWRVITAPASIPNQQSLKGVIDNNFQPSQCGTDISSIVSIEAEFGIYMFWLQAEGLDGQVSDLSNFVYAELPPLPTTTITVPMTTSTTRLSTTTTTLPPDDMVVTVDFDNPAAPLKLDGIYGGIDWGIDQWEVWDQNDLECLPQVAYMTCSPEGCRANKCRSFHFLSPSVLLSLNVNSYITVGAITITSYDEQDHIIEQYGPSYVPNNACPRIYTGWQEDASRIDVCFVYGSDLVIDNLEYWIDITPTTTTVTTTTVFATTTTTRPRPTRPTLKGIVVNE